MLRFAMILMVLVLRDVAVAHADPLASKAEVSPVCVILIGGIDSDPTPKQIDGTAQRGQGQSGLYQLAGNLAREGLATEYFNWNGTRAGKIKEKPPLAPGIVTFLTARHAEHPTERLAIVANSWGGHTAWEVCQALPEKEVAIELAVFLDPSSAGRAKTSRPETLPTCIKSARNYYTRNLFGWREWPNEERLINIDLGDTQHGFLVKGGPKYDSTFDPQAHIAAEWDSRIHDDITKHLVELLKAKPETPPIK